jgi:hypothetical protein
MSTEIAKHALYLADGLTEHGDEIAGQAETEGQSVSRMLGTILKFTNIADWVNSEGTSFLGKPLVVCRKRRTEVKWGPDNTPVEVIELAPDEPRRDLDQVNADCPQSEWREGPDGKLHGPWVYQQVIEFIDPTTLELYSWPTATIGGSIAIRELVERVALTRRLRGSDVCPLIELARKHMNTRFGGRERPHLEIKDWVRLGDRGIEKVGTDTRPLLQRVAEPSLGEELDDKLPY